MGAKHTYLNSYKTYIKWRITKSYYENPSLYKEITQKYKRVELTKAIENGVEQYNTNVEFKNKIDSAIEIERQKFNEKQANKWKDCNEKLGPEGRTARQNKRNETLGPEGRSKSVKRGRDNMGRIRRTDVANKTNACLYLWSNNHVSKGSTKRIVLKEYPNATIVKTIKYNDEDYNLYFEKYLVLSTELKAIKRARKIKGIDEVIENRSSGSKKAALCLYEWSNGFISKGPGKKFVINRFPGVYITKIIRFDDVEHSSYFKKWEKEFKPKKKGTGRGNTNVRLICPDGKISTPSGASRYCKTQGLDYSKCVPIK